jgi:hypothetical protein
MTTTIYEDYLTQLDRKLDAENRKILLSVDQCAAHTKNTTYLSNIKIVFLPANCTSQLPPLDLGIIHVFKCHYRKQLTVARIDGGLFQDAIQMKLDVLFAVLFMAEAWRLMTPMTIKNYFLKCSFLNYVSSNEDSAE